jgi:hypothetical protein
MITKKTWNGKTIVYHKLASDGGALTMMCGRYEKPQPSGATRWKIDMACCKAMDTHCQ